MKLKNFRVVRAKRTVLGRVICRLIGDEAGAVAMEYVVIALLIVAAAVGAAVFFGKTISKGMESSARMITNPDKGATSGQIRSELGNIETSGKTLTKKVSNDIAGGSDISDGAADETNTNTNTNSDTNSTQG